MPKAENMTAAQLRNLPHYRNLSEEELERAVDDVQSGGLEGRIEKVLRDFEVDYDLSGMTANDMLSLRELAKIFIQLDELSVKQQFEIRQDEPDFSGLEKIDRMMDRLRKNASTIQQDLNITRKNRQSQGGESIPELLAELQERAKHFLAQRLKEVYCPKCKMLLAKVWYLYPEENNKISVYCKRCKKPVVVDKFIGNKNIKAGPPF